MTDANSISAFKQAQVQQEVVFAVAKKTLDQARNEGDAAVAMLQAAVDMSRAMGQFKGPQPLGPGQTINFLA